MQQINVIGYVGQPAVSRTYEGQVVTNFSIAVNEKIAQKDGTKTDQTSWYDCSLWRKDKAHGLAEFLIKGMRVFVQGKPLVKSYVDKNGISRFSLEISVKTIEMLSTKEDYERLKKAEVSNEKVSAASVEPGNFQPVFATAETNDDLPF